MDSDKFCIAITLCEAHIDYCKCLITSIRHYYESVPIIILKDGKFDISFFNKMENIYIVDSEEMNELHDFDLYILLNKLNILFLPNKGFEFDYYVHLDADSILTNYIDESVFSDNADFTILQGGVIDFNDNKSKKSISNYAFNPLDFPEYKFDLKSLYFFSASHIVIKKTFIPVLIEYLKIHRFELNKIFLNDKRIRFNDQGFLNLIINYLNHERIIHVKLQNDGIYGYDKRSDFPFLNFNNVLSKVNTNVMFIHYTASSRKVFMKNHNFGDLLVFFLKKYYSNNFLFYFNEYKHFIKYYYNWFSKRVKMKINHLLKIK